MKRTDDPDLKVVLAWSVDVNAAVKKIVRDVPPFPFVRDCLDRIASKADAVVVSQTPTEALLREWQEHGIDRAVRTIAGQELGTKTEHISFAAGGKYEKEKILMIGDAPGDMKAAKGNGALFFPIDPGHEEASWELLVGEGLDRFFAGTFAGAYEAKLIERFNQYLPEQASWVI